MESDEQQLINQQIFDHQMQLVNDPVSRDMMCGDWKTKRSSKKNRMSLIFFLVMVLLMIAAIFVMAKAAPATTDIPSSQLYQQEMSKLLNQNPYDSLMTPEWQKQYDMMHQQLDEHKEAQGEVDWKFILLICSIPPLVFVGYIFRSYYKDKNYKPTWKEVFVVSGVTIVTAVVLYFNNVFFFYLRFYAYDSIRKGIVCLIIIVGAILLWYYSRKNTNKNKVK